MAWVDRITGNPSLYHREDLEKKMGDSGEESRRGIHHRIHQIWKELLYGEIHMVGSQWASHRHLLGHSFHSHQIDQYLEELYEIISHRHRCLGRALHLMIHLLRTLEEKELR